MGLPVEVNNLLLGGARAYTISRSLRFRSSASAYLNRTPASAGNRRTWTWSAWVKRGSLGSAQWVFDAFQDANNFTAFFFNSDNTFGIQYVLAATSKVLKYTTQVFRDPSAWYHIMVVADTTPATPTFTVYVNGSQVTAFGTNTNTVSQNEQLFVNNTVAHNIARYGGNANYFDGYLAEVNFIDGQALTPSSFGETDLNGIWQPKKYAGTYGTNGFYLPFSNTTSTTTLVQDSSGNGNNWTPNNISLTAGTTYDSMIDSPTVGAGASNYAVLNPLYIQGATAVLSDGNLQSTTGSTGTKTKPSTIAVSSGQWYWEVTPTAGSAGADYHIGIANADFTTTAVLGSTSTEYSYAHTGVKRNNNTSTAYGATYTTNDIIGVALDLDGGTLTYYKNGVSQGQAFSGISGTYVAIAGDGSTAQTSTFVFNFGQRPFTYTPPTGFNALNTYNLPAPSITNGAKNFNIGLYTGNGSTQSLTQLGFQPDFVWNKSRANTEFHVLMDSVRTPDKALYSNSTQAEDSGLGNTFTSTGMNVVSTGNINTNGISYVYWGWKGGGTAVTNNSGTISSQVSANTSAGFSIVTYTGTGANATVGHGLGVAPSFYITKSLSSYTNSNWCVYHKSLGATQYGILNSTSAFGATSTIWNNTEPTSSVFSLGTSAQTNSSGLGFVAYCFSAVSGYSAFGKYTGNGSTDGPFVYTGFRPRFILVKDSSAAQNWRLFDSSRSTYNAVLEALFPNLSNAESSAETGPDFLSNGFKIRTSSSTHNASGDTIIYMAFAENPFNISRAR